MCRSIKPLFNYDPPATDDDMHAAALQFVRKISGYNEPSKANQHAFDKAVSAATQVCQTLLSELQTDAKPRDREVEDAKKRERFAKSDKRY